MRGLPIIITMLVGCATASPENGGVDGNNMHAEQLDAPRASDASPTSPSCVPGTDLLMNGTFDATPVGMAWSGTPANPMYPIITANGLTPDSMPDKAWMGSVVSASDEMYQDVMVPAGVTKLTLAGVYEVRTTETGSTANDTATVELDANGATLEPVLSLDNTMAGTAWVPFAHTTTSAVAGHTVRVHFATTNNSTKATSFYFDTVSFQIAACQ